MILERTYESTPSSPATTSRAGRLHTPPEVFYQASGDQGEARRAWDQALLATLTIAATRFQLARCGVSAGDRASFGRPVSGRAGALRIRYLMRLGISVTPDSGIRRRRDSHARLLQEAGKRTLRNVRVVPEADECTAAKAFLFNHLVDAGE